MSWTDGAVDLHVHCAPSFFNRWGDGLDVILACEAAGMAAVLLGARGCDMQGKRTAPAPPDALGAFAQSYEHGVPEPELRKALVDTPSGLLG